MCKTTAKTTKARREWEEGQDIVRARWGPLRSAFKGGIKQLRDEFAALSKRIARMPGFDIAGLPESVDFTDFEAALAAGFEKSAVSVALKSSLEALKDLGAFEKTDSRLKGTMAEQLAIEFAQDRGRILARSVSASVRRSIEVAIIDGMERGASIPAITADIKDVVGLSERDARALMKVRNKMRRNGESDARIDAEIGRKSRKALRRRAETIARTEMIAARNTGTLNAWRQHQADGKLSPTARKVWIDADGCPECSELASMDAIPIGAMFESSFGGPYAAPPAHPSCRCSMGIVD